jgi:hypothetical protein
MAHTKRDIQDQVQDYSLGHLTASQEHYLQDHTGLDCPLHTRCPAYIPEATSNRCASAAECLHYSQP